MIACTGSTGHEARQYTHHVSGAWVVQELLPRLGIFSEVMPKSRRIENERVGAVVARGEAEIGFQQMSELLPTPGIEVLGQLPDSLQKTTLFSASVASGSRRSEEARQVIEFFSSADAVPYIIDTGLRPVLAP